MPVVGRITAKFDADTRSLDASLAAIESGVSGTTAAVTAGFSKMEGSLQKNAKAIEKASDAIVLKDKLEAGVALFGKIAGAVDGVRQEFGRAGDAADDLRDRLAATFGDLAEEKAKLAENQLRLGFDADSVANALVTLKKFGADSEDALKRLQDAARFTNQDVAGLAESFGRFEKFGDAKSLKALQKELGISAKDLENFGAKLKDQNTVLLEGEVNTNRAAAALRAYMEANFTGAAERQADAATNLAGEMEALKREIGLNVTSFKEGFAPAILEVVKGLRGMSGETKAAIGLTAEFVGVAASMAATALQVGSQLVLLSGNARLASAGIAACNVATKVWIATLDVALGPLGAAALAVTGLALAVAQYNNDLAEAADNQVILDAANERGIVQYEKNRELIGKNAEELRKMGKTAKDVGNLVEGLNAQQERARKANNGAGDKSAEESYRAQAAAANKVRSELEKIEEAEQKRKQKTAPTPSDLTESELEKKRKEALASKLADIEILSRRGDLSKRQEISRLQEILDAGNLNAEEQRKIALDIASLQGQIRDKDSADYQRKLREKEQAAKESAQRIAQNQKQQLDAQQSQLDAQIRGLQAKQVTGGNSAKIQNLIQDQLALKVKEIENEKNAALAIAKTADEKQAAIASAEQKIRAARQQTANELDAEKKRYTDEKNRQAQDAQKRVEAEQKQVENLKKQQTDAQKSTIDKEIQGLQDKNTAQSQAQVKALIQERLRLSEAEIKAERDVIIASTKNEEVKAAAVDAAEAKIKAARADATNALQQQADKQKQSLQQVQDKSKATADALIADQKAVTSQVGGANSPIFSDASQGLGISLGNFSLGDLAKQPTLIKQAQAVSPVQLQPIPGTPNPFIDPNTQAKAQGQATADALKQQPLAITLVANVGGKEKSTKFEGTADKLSSAANIFNADFTLGTP